MYICARLVFTTKTAITTAAVITRNWSGMMENNLSDAFAHGQKDRFVLVKVVDFKRQAVDVAWVNPARVKTDRNTAATPGRAGLNFAGTRWHNTKEFMRMRQD